MLLWTPAHCSYNGAGNSITGGAGISVSTAAVIKTPLNRILSVTAAATAGSDTFVTSFGPVGHDCSKRMRPYVRKLRKPKESFPSLFNYLDNTCQVKQKYSLLIGQSKPKNYEMRQ